MHLLRIHAPQVAAYAKPGQFVILMAKETSERTPFTLADWDAKAGSITLIIEEVGRSSRELISLSQGARLAHVSGPLGQAFPIEHKGTVVLGGGCYGIGAILPLARALKDVGNRVISVIEGSSAYLLYWEEEVRAVSDELRIATKDGTRGTYGGVQEVFQEIREQEKNRDTSIDMIVAVGCTFMMRMVSELTKPWAVPTFVALNPIMVDGTGMCGACRVSIHDETRFACIDGPFFDAHGVDWEELACRRGAYAREEVEALPQTVDLNALMFPETAKQGCGCGR
jgi:NAD(P)H-flavin reductase